MKKFLALATLAVTFLGTAPCNAQIDPSHYAVIPRPAKLMGMEGNFKLTRDVQLFPQTEAALSTAKYIADRFKSSAGFDLTINAVGTKPSKSGAIVLTTKGANRNLGNEGYTLDILPNAITISATTPAGLFYGTQTFFQLRPPAILTNAGKTRSLWLASCAHVEDSPRFAWRGLMLDVSRHYFTTAEIKRIIDEMALHKLNTLQLHLTDNDGWRVAIDKYPLLTEKAAWRSDIGYGLDPTASSAYSKDGKYGGFYSKNDIKDLVAYAATRNVTIVPEIEMPAHSAAAISAYPDLACQNDATSDVLCAGNENTYKFLQDVLAEVFELFPSKYVHIGGDEVTSAHWEKCEKCQTKMKELKLKTTAELENYMVQQVSKVFKANNRTLVGWSEIREGGGVPQGAVLMDWKGGGSEAANTGHEVVMAPTAACYLDYYQSPDYKSQPPAAPNTLIQLKQVYNFEPVPTEIKESMARNIIGTQGCVWTEYIPTMSQVEYQAFPRACAIAEVAWTPKADKNYNNFLMRMNVHAKRLLAMDVNFWGASLLKMAKRNPQN